MSEDENNKNNWCSGPGVLPVVDPELVDSHSKAGSGLARTKSRDLCGFNAKRGDSAIKSEEFGSGATCVYLEGSESYCDICVALDDFLVVTRNDSTGEHTAHAVSVRTGKCQSHS